MQIGKLLKFFGYNNGSPANGDLWYDGTDTKVYNGGVEKKVGLPPQAGNSGKFLTTDATNASWGTPSSGGSAVVARLATAAALPTNTYLLGVLTAVSVGALTVDGVAAATNDVILVKDEATGANNGLYTATNVGSIGAAYILTRHTSMDTTGEFVNAIIPVASEGTVNKNTEWRCTNATAPTVSTTAITFAILNVGTLPTVPVSTGGTGATTNTNHGVLIGQGSSAIVAMAVGLTGQTIGGVTGGDPVWQNRWVQANAKSATQSITASTALVDCTGLSFTMGANETWNFAIDFRVSAGSGGGLKWDITAPAGASGNVSGSGLNNITSNFDSTPIGTGQGSTVAIVNTSTALRLYGTIVNSSNAGTAQFRVAQNASSVTATIISLNGTMNAWRVS